MGVVVDKAELGQILSEYFGFFLAKHSTDCSTLFIIHHLGLMQ
jgi:hypothetical protein